MWVRIPGFLIPGYVLSYQPIGPSAGFEGWFTSSFFSRSSRRCSSL